MSQAMAIVAEANNLEDPLEPFPVFKKYCKNGIEVELFIRKCGKLDEGTKNWTFSLTKRNMQSKQFIFSVFSNSSVLFSRYEQCSWGWHDEKKLEELTDDAAWYLIAKSNDGILLGFSHFRFDLDEGVEVLYW